ncbi:5-methyltetrahydropteroyltriglutamate--homocysteine S-methyltransferase [Chondromyces crocatus]|uniref:5-methyltetrahydropteroyltriglutamate--homocysteine methyltransferase n=1 Tax=Chondromyces crocatus TaxID=52 RepID=A0A0K1ECD3_CHOCO|nr:5-methyltetrahydropteroyltriglutamate--homocysteine S-methyltransferase [Chondromyces crocatus]AKT38342.1 5-methyltetrahydropteroyltriglutamate-- homocysteine methyltransferase [Chondromyces crocatus]
MTVFASCLGHPRIGVARELKKALESFWAKKSSAEALEGVASSLRRRHWEAMKSAGIDFVPSNDFSLYDHVLDAAVMVGAVPARYRGIEDRLMRYFAMARGLQDRGAGVDVPALEMTKWFDTNYHYIVPELEEGQAFQLDATKLLAELEEARALGVETRPVILGPVTLLLLSKVASGGKGEPLDHLEALLPVYEQLLAQLAERHVGWVQIDEPCLVLDLSARARQAYEVALKRLAGSVRRPKILVATYFGALGDNLSLVREGGCEGLHVDLVRAPEQLDAVLAGLGAETVLSVGVVDGRNIWRTDLDAAHGLVLRAVARLGAARVIVAPSCSLLHVPVDLAAEKKLDAELKGWLAFAAQKLDEVRALAGAAESEQPSGVIFEEARVALSGRRASPRTRNPAVRARTAAVTEVMKRRAAPFADRATKQRARFQLPALPTTTIGSFPQTGDVRGARAAWRAGKMSEADYQEFLQAETRRCVEKQEALGLDVLVHGEFERTDMVEYFGERLEGYAFTENGWVQSYGSRCVKPPVLFGDVVRPEAMTVEWSRYAQSLTKRPMKGMLTGPVTILQWSFVRDDQPRSETCLQIALAIRDEVVDLEAGGIPIIQVDEPAIREGLPLRRGDWAAYLQWAVDAFRVATSGVRDETQIQTHMCYSEFSDILDSIAALDADVLLIETSRSRMELLVDFGQFRYPNDVGPGVYDIHSPRVPSTEEMVELLERAAQVLPVERLWVNPDCGLKTRGWPEVEGALVGMVEAAKRARARLAGRAG